MDVHHFERCFFFNWANFFILSQCIVKKQNKLYYTNPSKRPPTGQYELALIDKWSLDALSSVSVAVYYGELQLQGLQALVSGGRWSLDTSGKAGFNVLILLRYSSKELCSLTLLFTATIVLFFYTYILHCISIFFDIDKQTNIHSESESESTVVLSM